MNERDGDATFADGGGDPLDVPGPYISHREHTRTARLEQMGWPLQGPGVFAIHVVRNLHGASTARITIRS